MFLIADTKRMIDDIKQSSFWLGVWGRVLNFPQILGGVIFLPRLEAILVLLACVGSVVVAAQMHKRSPFTRLTSWVHLPWVALLPYLVNALIEQEIASFFAIWLAYTAATISVSLMLDVRNLFLLYFTDNDQFEGANR